MYCRLVSVFYDYIIIMVAVKNFSPSNIMCAFSVDIVRPPKDGHIFLTYVIA